MKTVFQKLNKGFTLLEVLIALSILAISSIAVLTQTGQSISHLQQLQSKTMALIIAENQLNALQIGEQWPGTGRQSTPVSYVDREWLVTTEVTSTAEPWLRKIIVTVSADDHGDESPLVSLVGYRGLH